jgi:hypothetical protein
MSRRPVEVAAAMTTTPVKAITRPETSARGKPSPRKSPANTAMRIGPTLINSAVVPASRCRSAALTSTA